VVLGVGGFVSVFGGVMALLFVVWGRGLCCFVGPSGLGWLEGVWGNWGKGIFWRGLPKKRGKGRLKRAGPLARDCL